MTLPDLLGVLSEAQVRASGEAIADLQLPSGQIQWFPGGHADPWNHVEAAMALMVAGRRREAERAYDWLEATQHRSGAWFNYYIGDEVEDRRLDTNVVAYVATGVWHHRLVTGDDDLVEATWPMVESAIEFVLRLQEPSGEILWCIEADGTPGRFALLTGSSSIFLSLRCALAIAWSLGHERPEWELAAARLGAAIAFEESRFEPKTRWAMDWYYPVLTGAIASEAGSARIDEEWSTFVMEGLGVRCVSDRPWVTTAETAELVVALDAVGRVTEARRLLTSVQYLRQPDGSYWTGCVHPEEIHFPGDERSSYSAAAVLLAADALGGLTKGGGLWRGEGVPAIELVVDDLERET